jgi:hypothetical protein
MSSVVPVLTDALRQASSPRDRETWAWTLGNLGPAARDAVPALAETVGTATGFLSDAESLGTFAAFIGQFPVPYAPAVGQITADAAVNSTACFALLNADSELAPISRSFRAHASRASRSDVVALSTTATTSCLREAPR